MNSTPRVDHARQCAGKVPHVDRRAARQARQKLGHRDAEGHLTIYRCPWCDRFHIGHAFADPYLADKAARAAQQANAVAAGAELDLEAGRALAALAVIRGETRPSRVNLHAPDPPPTVARPPEYLDLDALGVWQRLAPSLIARGVLTPWDADAFAAYCTAVVHHRRAVLAVNKAGVMLGTGRNLHKHPALQVVRDQAALIVTLGGRFGLTPSDRSSIHLPDAEDDGDGLLD